MFFYLSKIIGFFLQPTVIMLTLLVSGVIMLLTGKERFGRHLIILSAAMLVISAFSPLGNILLLPLEDRFQRPDFAELGNKVDGIVVLGGASDTLIGKARNSQSLTEAAERMTEAVALSIKFPNAKIVFSGGSGSIVYEHAVEAEGARHIFSDLSVDRGRLILEGRSRNTYQNALFTKEVAKPKDGEVWLLVTSAYHMPRSIGCFRQVGFPVRAWPVDYRTRGIDDAWRFFDRPSEGLRRIDLVIREWIGLIVYWLAGKTNTFLPAP